MNYKKDFIKGDGRRLLKGGPRDQQLRAKISQEGNLVESLLEQVIELKAQIKNLEAGSPVVTKVPDNLFTAEQVDEEIKIEILYSYEVRPEFGPDKLIPGSRDFCRELITLDRLYTRQEINAISAEVGRDVWSYRGGWYHNPKTGVNTPSCRHTWMQNVNIG